MRHEAGHYKLYSREVAYGWKCVGTHASNADAREHERLLCRADNQLAGFTRVVPAVNHRWGVEVRDDKMNGRRWHVPTIEDTPRTAGNR